jgi:putative YhbY family RNA-binding protein
MLKLTPAERSELRSQAHGLKPIVLIGDAGLTPAVMKEIDAGLNVHGLIKVRVFGDDRDARVGMYEAICAELGAVPVQNMGNLLVIYRHKN